MVWNKKVYCLKNKVQAEYSESNMKLRNIFLNVTGKFMKFHPVNQTAIKNHFDICQEASEKLLIQCNKDHTNGTKNQRCPWE